MMGLGKEVEKVNKEHHSPLMERKSVGNHVACMEGPQHDWEPTNLVQTLRKLLGILVDQPRK
jgi:hypothetical protein